MESIDDVPPGPSQFAGMNSRFGTPAHRHQGNNGPLLPEDPDGWDLIDIVDEDIRMSNRDEDSTLATPPATCSEGVNSVCSRLNSC